MKQNVLRIIFCTVLGALAQYYWMQSIPSMAEQAPTVVFATGLICIISLLVFKQIINSESVIALLVVLIGAIAAVAAFWVFEFFDSPYSIHILKKYSLAMFGFSAVATGGWVVGLLFGLSRKWLCCDAKPMLKILLLEDRERTDLELPARGAAQRRAVPEL